ncbi:nuclear transport factor 2 family protein [Streptomyces sp. NPDC057682]|uniref:nuclear transport factor 2 family protein n=1 Tax=Streptomyces sp. NPDC057682 TaxID=3346210 RepID=UPI0036878DE2
MTDLSDTAQREIVDRMEVGDLFARLGGLLDERRIEDAGTVYHESVVVRSPKGELHGLDEVTALLKRSTSGDERSQHTYTSVLVQVDGDRARTTANGVTYFYREGSAPHRSSGLRMTCEAVRTPAGWRFADAHIALAWLREE